jgi:hypothetical protein
MTVAELIERLSRYPADVEVITEMIVSCPDGCPIAFGPTADGAVRCSDARLAADLVTGRGLAVRLEVEIP